MLEVVEVILDSLKDTGKILPILFLTYLLMEYLEHHAGGRLAGSLQRSRGAGPVLGALVGLLPQCGFSGAASSFYAAGTITAGTLLAVFLSTSDEMLPIFLSAQVPGTKILLILGIKLFCGVLVGCLVDLVLGKRSRDRNIHTFCQQEHCSCEGGILRSAVVHTVKIIVLIFVVTTALNVAFLYLPREAIASVWKLPVVGELAAAVIGLFPNCAASVTISNLYLEGLMGPGPMLAGLLVNGGVGLLVLFRVNRNRKENWSLTAVLLLSGVVLGTVFGRLLAFAL